MEKQTEMSAGGAAPRVDGRPRGRRQQESERRRQRILDAARRCFGELGFAGARVETIAAQAGVSSGLLYQFFRGKEHLFEVVVEELMRDWVRSMFPEDTEPERSRADALEAMIRNSVEFAKSHPLLPMLLADDALLELDRFSDVRVRRRDAHRTHVAGVLQQGVDRGEFRPDLDVSSVADIVCQLHAEYAGRACRRQPESPVTPTLVDALVSFVREALRR